MIFEDPAARQPSFRSALGACMLAALAASPAIAETLLERGAYLVEGIAACGTCHARAGAEAPEKSADLSGGTRLRLRGYLAYAANITPDRDTGIGSWTDRDIVRAIRGGRRPDGSRIGGMPYELYRKISDRDALAIAAYLRSRKPVAHAVPRLPARTPAAPPAPVPTTVPETPRSDPVRYGAYLAGPLGRCIECHTPSRNGGPPDYDNMLGAGGVVFSGPWGEAVSGNITPDPDTGLGEFTDFQIREMIVRGLRPDRSRVGGPMAHTFYRRITEDDLNAVLAYLRSLKPIENFVDK